MACKRSAVRSRLPPPDKKDLVHARSFLFIYPLYIYLPLKRDKQPIQYSLKRLKTVVEPICIPTSILFSHLYSHKRSPENLKCRKSSRCLHHRLREISLQNLKRRIAVQTAVRLHGVIEINKAAQLLLPMFRTINCQTTCGFKCAVNGLSVVRGEAGVFGMFMFQYSLGNTVNNATGFYSTN